MALAGAARLVGSGNAETTPSVEVVLALNAVLVPKVVLALNVVLVPKVVLALKLVLVLKAQLTLLK